MNHLAAVLDPEPDPFAGLPVSWSVSARDVYVQITEDHPYLDAASRAALYEAAAGLASADHMQARVDADGLLVEGSQGQKVAHPLIAEVRQARVQALAALRSLGLAAPASGASAAGSQLANKRWSGRTAGVRAGR